MDNFRLKVTSAFVAFSICVSLNAHEGEKHSVEAQLGANAVFVPESVVSSYRQKVEPILRKACFDCHSSNTAYPWYSNIPGVKGLIADDINEARKHLDMTEGLPFKGHGSIAEDLLAIRKSIQENTMPPWRYRIMHSESRLSSEEKKRIVEWVDSSLKSI
jgi:hypothetical protein